MNTAAMGHFITATAAGMGNATAAGMGNATAITPAVDHKTCCVAY